MDQPTPFYPAESASEAIARIFALTGASSPSRGEKRALLALRDALGLDIEVVRTGAEFSRRIAAAMRVEWDESRCCDATKVTLAGLNVLLEGAQRSLQSGELRRLQGTSPPALVGLEWKDFQPAASKIEAVTRIAALTGAPAEHLGPGSKEHKSVLLNLADRMLPGASLDRRSKTRLGASIAAALDVPWTDDCASTGETISLVGLNILLAGAERRLGRLGSNASSDLNTPDREAQALLAALADGFGSRPWRGEEITRSMVRAGMSSYNQMEWPGFWFEGRGIEILNASFAPSPSPPISRYGNTVFDYRLHRVWDLKAHTAKKVFPLSRSEKSERGAILLNDQSAIRSCVADQGLGFIVLSGQAVMDEDGSFKDWHDAFKTSQGLIPARANREGRSRLRKSEFWPLRLDALWIESTAAMDSAIAGGILRVMDQGRQAPKATGQPGSSRAPKLLASLQKAVPMFGVAALEMC